MKIARQSSRSKRSWNRVFLRHYERSEVPTFHDQGDGTEVADVRRKCAIDLLEEYPDRYFRPAEDESSDDGEDTDESHADESAESDADEDTDEAVDADP